MKAHDLAKKLLEGPDISVVFNNTLTGSTNPINEITEQSLELTNKGKKNYVVLAWDINKS